MTEEQLLAYAQDALASGDTAAMLAAYNLLRTTDDPEIQLLVCDLAIGIANMASLTVRMVAEIDANPDDPAAALNTVFADLTDADLARFVEAAAILQAENGSSAERQPVTKSTSSVMQTRATRAHIWTAAFWRVTRTLFLKVC